jgi:hypothetical protein
VADDVVHQFVYWLNANTSSTSAWIPTAPGCRVLNADEWGDPAGASP